MTNVWRSMRWRDVPAAIARRLIHLLRASGVTTAFTYFAFSITYMNLVDLHLLVVVKAIQSLYCVMFHIYDVI